VLNEEGPSPVIVVAESADVSDKAVIGDGSKIWHLAQVREQAELGVNCIVGRGAYVGTGVQIGENTKIQNYALVYEPAKLGKGVFIGPAVVLTNDTYPRSVSPDGSLKSAHDWTPVGVTIEDGASIGARAVCVAPLTSGTLGHRCRRCRRHQGCAGLCPHGRCPCPAPWLGGQGR
jgi:UDP-2-acetamido-3-amino-2,3-dideoxy-glucuronate N-acetyltransferase